MQRIVETLTYGGIGGIHEKRIYLFIVTRTAAFTLFFLGSSGVGGARGGGGDGASSTVMRKSGFVGGVAEPASPVDWDGPGGDKRSVFLWERTSGPTGL